MPNEGLFVKVLSPGVIKAGDQIEMQQKGITLEWRHYDKAGASCDRSSGTGANLAKEIMKSSPLKYKLGEGFNFTSSDGKFSSSIGASYQFRYTLMNLDDVNNTATKHDQDVSDFELKRIKLLLNGYAYSKDLTYKLSLNFTNISGGTISNGGLLEETWMNYRLLNEVQFRFGQDKVPFSRQFITPATALQFIEPLVVTCAFIPGYDTGLMVHGKIADWLINYNISRVGGVGQNTYRTTVILPKCRNRKVVSFMSFQCPVTSFDTESPNQKLTVFTTFSN